MSGRPVSEPHNIAQGWVGFNFEKAFGCAVKIMNDAAMQALGSYKQGKMLFLGPGNRTRIHDDRGWSCVADGAGSPAHLPYRSATFEDYVGLRDLQRLGEKKWRQYVADVIEQL